MLLTRTFKRFLRGEAAAAAPEYAVVASLIVVLLGIVLVAFGPRLGKSSNAIDGALGTVDRATSQVITLHNPNH